jgi:hypothetical protein
MSLLSDSAFVLDQWFKLGQIGMGNVFPSTWLYQHRPIVDPEASRDPQWFPKLRNDLVLTFVLLYGIVMMMMTTMNELTVCAGPNSEALVTGMVWHKWR